MITQKESSIKRIRHFSSPDPSVPSTKTVTTTDSGVNISTGCTISRSPTPDLCADVPSISFEIDSVFNRTLTQENFFEKNHKITHEKSDWSLNISNKRSNRIKRVLKKYEDKYFF